VSTLQGRQARRDRHAVKEGSSAIAFSTVFALNVRVPSPRRKDFRQFYRASHSALSSRWWRNKRASLWRTALSAPWLGGLIRAAQELMKNFTISCGRTGNFVILVYYKDAFARCQALFALPPPPRALSRHSCRRLCTSTQRRC